MKNLFLLFSLLFFCACAGNPPAWWNPSGAYGAQRDIQPSQKNAVEPSFSGVVTAEEEEPMEQTFTPAFDSYEEMRLTPLPETDGTEETSQTQSEPQEEAEELNLGRGKTDSASAVSNTKVEENLPEDGSLPPPSVLE